MAKFNARQNWLKNAPPEARIIPGLFRSRNHIWNNDHKIVESHGLTWSQFLALSSLRSAEPDHILSPTQLYTGAQVTSGGMTKMLHALGAAELITRVKNENDGRSKLVQLTDKGARLAEAIVDDLVDRNQKIISGILTTAESDQLADLLAKLSRGLEDRANLP